jgi:hypothetical protein
MLLVYRTTELCALYPSPHYLEFPLMSFMIVKRPLPLSKACTEKLFTADVPLYLAYPTGLRGFAMGRLIAAAIGLHNDTISAIVTLMNASIVCTYGGFNARLC